MIVINTYEQIRYLFAVKKLPQREIAKKLGISRNTVKRYCQGENVPWESKSRSRQRPVTQPIEETVEKRMSMETCRVSGLLEPFVEPFRDVNAVRASD